MTDVWVGAILSALPIFGRTLGLVVGAPFFGQRGVPVQVRVGLALLLAAIFAPLFASPVDLATFNPLKQAVLFGGELIIGLAMGFVTRLVFAAVQLSGQIMEVPMGLGMAGVYDPVQGGQVPLFGNFYYLLVAQVFFLTNGHLGVLRALGDSFSSIPPGTGTVSDQMGSSVFAAFGWMFVTGVRIALPVVMAVLVTDVALGVAVRVVPQFNIFMVGFSLKIAIGLFAAALSISALVNFAGGVFAAGGQFFQQVYGFLQGLAGG